MGCVAELLVARSEGIPQSIQIISERSIDQNYCLLAMLDVRACQASHQEDKEKILSKIPDIDRFNEDMQILIFGADGLLKAWMDGKSRASNIGRIAARAFMRAVV